MSGTWAREADAMVLSDFSQTLTLKHACQGLLYAMEGDFHPEWWLLYASAIIRRERKRLDPQGMTAKHGDWGDKADDESLIWYALRAVAIAANSTPSPAWHLREAEAALRTLHKRGRVG